MNEFDLAYAAGVIDSDGWIIIARSNSSYRIVMGLSQATPEAPNLMQELFGGPVSLRKAHASRFSSNPMYVWYIGGKRAAKAIFKLLPYLRIKVAQANLAIDYSNMIEAEFEKLGTRGSIGLSSEDLVKRTTYYLAMKELNHHAAAETEREGLDSMKNQVSDSPTYKDGKLVETDGNDLSA